MNYLYSNNSDTLKNVKENNDSWKVSLLPFAYNIPSLGQFNNNKPLKGLSLMAMKYYWYNEFNEAKKENNIFLAKGKGKKEMKTKERKER